MSGEPKMVAGLHGLKIPVLEPYTPAWEQKANQVARSYVSIHPCRHCGGPVARPYCCGRCGSVEP